METTLLQQSGMSAGLIAILLIMYRVLKSVNGNRIVSSCCGKKTELGFVIEPITPQAQAPLSQPQENVVMTTNPMSATSPMSPMPLTSPV
jgi:hypothetical protein